MNQIFTTDDITPRDLEKIPTIVKSQIEHLPEAKDDYVLAEKIKGEITIRFFRKDRIDHACNQTKLSPEEFIKSIFRTCTNPDHNHKK